MNSTKFSRIPAFAILLLSQAALAAWEAPIGIPTPSFGINEVAPVYNQSNTLHYYVNNATACSDSNNGGRGSPSAPRCSVPSTLAAGSYVEVHGGPYRRSSDTTWTVNGTSSAPVFIRGASSTRPVFEDSEITLSGSYAIVDNLEVTWPGGSGRFGLTGQYLALRNSYLHHSNSNHMVRPSNATHVVIYKNEIAYNGNPGRDLSGVGPGPGMNRLWVVDNHIHHIWNDGLLFCHGCTTNAPANIYIGRNEIHDNGENAIDIKYTGGPVVISQNHIYEQRNLANSGGGPAIRVNDEGTQGPVWILFNRIRDSINGINPSGANAKVYAIGNVIYNIDGYALNTGSVYSINNTTYNTGSTTRATTKLNNLELTTSNASLYVTNPATGDFRLIQNSPAIDAGEAMPQEVINTFVADIGIVFPLVDFAGASRPQGPKFDLGAYEYGSGPSVRPSSPTSLRAE